jgi:hypothetical protein
MDLFLSLPQECCYEMKIRRNAKGRPERSSAPAGPLGSGSSLARAVDARSAGAMEITTPLPATSFRLSYVALSIRAFGAAAPILI